MWQYKIVAPQIRIGKHGRVTVHGSLSSVLIFNFKLSFDDNSPKGFHRFIPSSQWLRDLFDSFVEKHGYEYDQHTALLPLKKGKIDHSFKVGT